jgi:hypothetical protein
MTGLPAEGHVTFRLARLTLLLTVVEEYESDGVDLARLGIYDFLAANPLLVARDDGDPDRLRLRLAGFDDRALAYASPAQRFVTCQLGLPDDVALLLGLGLVECTVRGRIRYRVTADGRALAGRFGALYAQSYMAAARTVVGRLRRLSDRRLRENVWQWLSIGAQPRPGRLDPADLIDLNSDADTTSPHPAWRIGFTEDET